jgi:hypothetical protein
MFHLNFVIIQPRNKKGSVILLLERPEIKTISEDFCFLCSYFSFQNAIKSCHRN